MSRNPRLYLEDIQLGCRKVLRFTEGLSFEQFFQNDLVHDAVLRNLEIIGEAAKNVPEDIRDQFPSIEWRKISSFRDIAAHQYFSLSNSIVWDIIQNKIPELNHQVDNIIKELKQ